MSTDNTSSSGTIRKIAATALAVALAAVLMIGGTISYLQASSDEVENTFDTNHVDVDISENTGDDYNIIPGTSETKDPTVTVSASVDTYVFLIVEDNTYGLVEYEIDEDVWTKLVIEDCPICSELYSCSEDCTCIPLELEIWYAAVSASDSEVTLNVLKDRTVSYSASLTNDDMTGYADDKEDEESENEESEDEETTDPDITLSFQAFAIQQASFEVYDDDGNLNISSSAIQALLSSDYYYSLLEANGWTLVSTADELTSALSNGGNIAVTADIAVAPVDSNASSVVGYSLTVTTDTTLYLGNHTLSFDLSDVSEDVLENSGFVGVPVLIGVTSGSLTIMGGTVDASAGLNSAYPVAVNGSSASVTLNCGTYTGLDQIVYVLEGSATINCGYFEFNEYHQSYYTSLANYYLGEYPAYSSTYGNYAWWCRYMLNLYDDADASITVKGGTFVDYNPSESSSEDPTADFVASGYSVTSSTNDGHTYYTVSASTSTDSE